MSGLLMDPQIQEGNCLSQFFPSDDCVHGTPFERSCSTKVADLSDHDINNDENSVTKKHIMISTDSSTVVDNSKLESGEQVTQKVTTMDRKRRINRYGSSSNSSQSKEIVARGKKQKNCSDSSVKDNNNKEEKKVKQNKNGEGKKDQDEPPTGYIHVRARRGQATDSHSLAERLRREKISERMKMLQKLVPGCEKVTGKALMLDEIINYVQSLQNQVEFLSMKLASLNPMFYDFGMDLDAFLVRPVGLNTLASQINQSVPQCSQNQPTAVFAADHNSAVPAPTNFNVTANDYPILDNSDSLLLQQGHRPSAFSNENGTLLWDVEDHRQSFLNPSGFSNLCSFN
ncbi:hypothetical protein L484_008847 [Morus notabilis]|uniref:BHLH domain-containing protein n=2 Tax=Morus notabilis TaxID=981085 RepID=W9R5J1_9ROSA|nr:hypothetical protein L484_008847 [Morus notabilis]